MDPSESESESESESLFIIKKTIKLKYQHSQTETCLERPLLVLVSPKGSFFLGILKSRSSILSTYHALFSPGTVVRLTDFEKVECDSDSDFLLPSDIQSEIIFSSSASSSCLIIKDLEIVRKMSPKREAEVSNENEQESLKKQKTSSTEEDHTDTNTQSGCACLFLDQLDSNSKEYNCLVRVIGLVRSTFASKNGERSNVRVLFEDGKENRVQTTLWDTHSLAHYGKWFQLGTCLLMKRVNLRHIDQVNMKYNKGTIPYELDLARVEAAKVKHQNKTIHEGDEIVEDEEDEDEEKQEDATTTAKEETSYFDFYSEILNPLQLTIPGTSVIPLHSLLDLSELGNNSTFNMIGYVLQVDKLEKGEGKGSKKPYFKRNVHVLHINNGAPMGRAMTLWGAQATDPLWEHPEFLSCVQGQNSSPRSSHPEKEKKEMYDINQLESECKTQIQNLSSKPLVFLHKFVVRQQGNYPKQVQSGYESSICWLTPDYLSRSEFFFPGLDKILQEAQIYDTEISAAGDPNNQSMEHIPTPIELPTAAEQCPKSAYEVPRRTFKQITQWNIQSRKFRPVLCRVSHIPYVNVDSFFVFQCECGKGFLSSSSNSTSSSSSSSSSVPLYKCFKCSKEFTNVSHLPHKFRLEVSFQDESTIQVIRVYEELACKLLGVSTDIIQDVWYTVTHPSTKGIQKLKTLIDQSYKKKWVALFQCDRLANPPSDANSSKVWMTLKSLEDVSVSLENQLLSTSIDQFLNHF